MPGSFSLFTGAIMAAMIFSPSGRRWVAIGCSILLAAGASAGEIHDAVLAHDMDRVRQLLLEKPDLVNARTERGDTPLYIAAFRGYVKQMIPLLLQYGADPAPSPNDRLETPLSIAREQNLRQTAAALLQAGARDDHLSRAAEFRYLVLKRDLTGLAQMAGNSPPWSTRVMGMGRQRCCYQSLATSLTRPPRKPCLSSARIQTLRTTLAARPSQLQSSANTVPW